MATNRYKNRHPLSSLVLKDDPCVSFGLPQQILHALNEVRRKSHRNLGNEIITRIACSLKQESQFVFMKPIVQFDFITIPLETLTLRQMRKAPYLQEPTHKQLEAVKSYFQKQEGFMAISQQFPKELWKRLQIKALEHESSIHEEMSLRLMATLQEPALFELPHYPFSDIQIKELSNEVLQSKV